jgi:serine/threonine protein kinase/tetratricopeptide (TPR) repeat protein
MTLSAGTRLGPYEILAPIGAGGMGEVYRARDAKLDRDVAVKVLPAQLTANADALARFEREAKAVAALSHPNILAIFDFGTHDGVSYAVTELLKGETLRGKLDGSTVTQRQAVDWALQIAKGLSAAHGKGVVHRDLKPENVFVTNDGHVKILDFGLAKRVDAAPGEQTSAPTGTGGGHTEPGTVMGTMGYMSPEQVRGLPVDHRSDLFSFGAILYELLSGKKAFKRDTASDTVAAIMRDEPPELTQSGRNVSPALDHIVRHCLEKDRENRFQTAKDVAFALSEALAPTTGVSSGSYVLSPPRSRGKTLTFAIVAGVAVLLVVAALLWNRSKLGPSSAKGGVKRIAVLPFENLGAPEDDYFADGIADEIRGKLTSLPGIEVIARGSSTPYKKTNKTPQEIARELSASYLLTATVRWQKGAGGSRVQVNPELVEIKSDGPPSSKWQQPFNADLTDVFQVQSDIASKVAGALGLALGEGQKEQLSEKPTQNLAAYDEYLKGEEASGGSSRSDPASLRKSLSYYEQAVALDPSFALAWSRISTVEALLYSNAVPTPELGERARQAAEKSITLAPRQYEGYRALGGYYRLVVGDPARARQEYEKAFAIAPGRPDIFRSLSYVEANLGRWDEALEHARQGIRLDPRAASYALADTLLRLRRAREARQEMERLLAMTPSNLNFQELLAMTYLSEGDLQGARASLGRAAKSFDPAALVAYVAEFNDLVWVLDPEQTRLLRGLKPEDFDDPASWALCQTQAAFFAGDLAGAREYADKARAALEQQLGDAPNDAQLHGLHGISLAYLGRKDDAIREGERGVALRGIKRDAVQGTSDVLLLARICTLVGEHEKAIDNLEQLLKVPSYLSPGWLKIDPNFDSLRGNPRFQKLVGGAA